MGDKQLASFTFILSSSVVFLSRYQCGNPCRIPKNRQIPLLHLDRSCEPLFEQRFDWSVIFICWWRFWSHFWSSFGVLVFVHPCILHVLVQTRLQSLQR